MHKVGKLWLISISETCLWLSYGAWIQRKEGKQSGNSPSSQVSNDMGLSSRAMVAGLERWGGYRGKIDRIWPLTAYGVYVCVCSYMCVWVQVCARVCVYRRKSIWVVVPVCA